jgi:hypothetical protein
MENKMKDLTKEQISEQYRELARRLPTEWYKLKDDSQWVGIEWKRIDATEQYWKDYNRMRELEKEFKSRT